MRNRNHVIKFLGENAIEIGYEVGLNSLWLKFSVAKIFGRTIKGTENSIDLKKYNPGGFLD